LSRLRKRNYTKVQTDKRELNDELFDWIDRGNKQLRIQDRKREVEDKRMQQGTQTMANK